MPVKPLPVKKLRMRVSASAITVGSNKLASPPIFIGRDRARKALEFGLDIDEGTYHIFALGPSGIGKRSTILHLLKDRVKNEPVPDDWCYVYNFQDATRPVALTLPAGRGSEFKKAIDNYIKEARTRIDKAFESEEYGRLLQSISNAQDEKKHKEIQDLRDKAGQYGYQITETPFGLAFVPVVAGRSLADAEIAQLDRSMQDKLQKGRRILSDESAALARHIRIIERETAEKQTELNKEIVRLTIEPLTEELRNQFTNLSSILEHINKIDTDIVDNATTIKEEVQEKESENILRRIISGEKEFTTVFDRYSVNLFISHEDCEVPIVTEHLPTVPHLVGRYEFRPRLGGMITDFTMIQPGALQKANGGYLILDAVELLTQPFAWEVLKSALQNKCIRIEDVGERLPYTLPTPTLRPEPIPLTAKVILTGDPTIYYLLAMYDKDFLELFKVKADFDVETKINKENLDKFANFVSNFSKEELQSDIEPEGIARLAEEAARLAGHQDKLSLHYRDLTDILREAKYWATAHSSPIKADDIRKAVKERIYRSNLVEEKVQEMIAENTLFIDTKTSVVGQVNGLAVIPLGDYQFGKPSRITARTYVGKEGIVNIERQTDLSGPIHGKAVLILSNYLGGQYAQEVPMALSATITFEQEYGGIEGDSATLSETCALLSSLANVPARQDLAITGSVNQHGTVQPVGGINEKIEGFFAVCRNKGLTGSQGVIIPSANAKHLMLHDDILKAAEDGLFRIYPVKEVDEAIELITGKTAQLIHDNARQRLSSYAEHWRHFTHIGKEEENTSR